MKRLSTLAASLALLAAYPATARADIYLDFVNLIGSSGAKTGSITFGTGGFGNITASTDPATPTSQVYSKNFGAPTGDAEKGLGVCSSVNPGFTVGVGDAANNCAYGNEVGDAVLTVPGGSLFVDFSGLTATTTLTQIFLGSVQTGEGGTIRVFFGGNYNTILYDALGGGVGDVVTFNYTGAMVGLYGARPKLRFDYKAPASGNLSDFLVSAANVSTTVPEPGTMGLLATGLVALTGAGYLRRRKK